jgi:ABC-type transporter Mla MlaB component
VTYETARAVHVATRAELAVTFEQSPESVEVDLSGVTSGNSLVLSLMLTWLRQARQQERNVIFSAVPSQLLELIRFTGLDGILPIAREPAA